MTSHAVPYERVRIYQQKGQAGLMSRWGRIEAGVYKTKALLNKELSDDPEELKGLAARPIAEKAILEQELELAKFSPKPLLSYKPPFPRNQAAHQNTQRKDGNLCKKTGPENQGLFKRRALISA